MNIAEFCQISSTAKKDELVKDKAYCLVECSDGRYASRDKTYPTKAATSIAKSGVFKISKDEYKSAKKAEKKGKEAGNVGSGSTRGK